MSIAVIKKENGIYTIGADCAWFRENSDCIDTTHTKYSKLRYFQNHLSTNFYIAGVGLQKDMSILYDIVIPEKISRNELVISTDCAMPDLYKLFIDYRNKAKEAFGNDTYSIDETLYIIAFENQAYVFNSGGIIPVNDYTAIGSGESYAFGALYNGATVAQAIYTACHFCSTCSVQNTVPIIMEVR